MQPMRVERVAATVEAEVPASNGRENGHAANGHTNGNGKGRRSKSAAASVAVTAVEGMPDLLVEVGGE
jgi:hypothetical protein